MTRICIIPCHATLQGPDPAREEDWILEDYQRDGGHHLRCFLSHIKAGMAWLESNPEGLLIPSGGRTRRGCRLSEAASYLEAARKTGLVSDPAALERVLLEVYARDSFENVLLSIAAAFSQTQSRVTSVTAIGFAFKAQRFQDHFSALELGPETTFEYFGLNDPVEPNLTTARANEQRTRAAFQPDAPDTEVAWLRTKRLERSWSERRVHYLSRCTNWPDLHRVLLRWNTENP